MQVREESSHFLQSSPGHPANPETACPQTDRRPPAHAQPSKAPAQDKDTQPLFLPQSEDFQYIRRSLETDIKQPVIEKTVPQISLDGLSKNCIWSFPFIPKAYVILAFSMQTFILIYHLVKAMVFPVVMLWM